MQVRGCTFSLVSATLFSISCPDAMLTPLDFDRPPNQSPAKQHPAHPTPGQITPATSLLEARTPGPAVCKPLPPP